MAPPDFLRQLNLKATLTDHGLEVYVHPQAQPLPDGVEQRY